MGELRRVTAKGILGSTEPLLDIRERGAKNLGYRLFDIVRPGGIPTLRCPTLERARDVSHASTLRDMANNGRSAEGRAIVQSRLETDLPFVATGVIRGRHTDKNRRPEILGQLLNSIASQRVFTGLTDEQWLQIMYREPSGLKALRDAGIKIDPNIPEIRITMPRAADRQSGQVVTIPLVDTPPNQLGLEITPVEIHAIAELLHQIGVHNLRKFGLTLGSDPDQTLSKLLRATSSARPQLALEGVLNGLYSKLKVLTEKGLMAPFRRRSPEIEALAMFFDQVPTEKLQELLSHGLRD